MAFAASIAVIVAGRMGQVREQARALREWFGAVPRRELLLVAGAMALCACIVVAYAIATRPNGLAGDQREYDSAAKLFADGKLFWSTLPFGIEHASMSKAPGYGLWTGVIYTIFGASPTKVAILQGLIFAPLMVFGTWALARRLFDPTVAIISAYVVAVFPLAWEYFGLLYPEVLAIPLTVLVFWLFLGREPTRGLVIATGVAMGVSLLVRPSAGFLFAGIAAAWILATDWRRGLGWTALTIGIAALVIAPWTIRNMTIDGGGFVPISYQDAAGFGTFNDSAANDPVYPYAWRPNPDPLPEVMTGPPVGDYEYREGLQDAMYDYISDHPASVLEAFYWNGLTRFWDVRRPAHALDEVEFEGRSRAVTAIGLIAYYAILPLALLGLWRIRDRRDIVFPLLLIALAASVVFTVDASTRYRATLEPMLVILAVTAVTGLWRSRFSSLPEESRAAA